jgi:RNA-directed DNA polymerase
VTLARQTGDAPQKARHRILTILETELGLFDFFKKRRGQDLDQLAVRLDVSQDELCTTSLDYRKFKIPKRSGGQRRIFAPNVQLKKLQRRILKRLLGKLKVHAAATGFERNSSIVTNAIPHADKAVVVRLDIKDFFPKTLSKRVHDYFKKIGWNEEAASILTRLCTKNGGLPQGAPTSPKLSNLINYILDVRLAALANRFQADYTRYADDMTFSFVVDQPYEIQALIRTATKILADYDYRTHSGKKLHIRRQHDQQLVTGLVVNQGVRLPRKTRRWLRAVEYRTFIGGGATLTPKQLAGWESFRAMVEKQTNRKAAGE